jgi:uncharacterized protein YydD (DUF2326 family)
MIPADVKKLVEGVSGRILLAIVCARISARLSKQLYGLASSFNRFEGEGEKEPDEEDDSPPRNIRKLLAEASHAFSFYLTHEDIYGSNSHCEGQYLLLLVCQTMADRVFQEYVKKIELMKSSLLVLHSEHKIELDSLKQINEQMKTKLDVAEQKIEDDGEAMETLNKRLEELENELDEKDKKILEQDAALQHNAIVAQDMYNKLDEENTRNLGLARLFEGENKELQRQLMKKNEDILQKMPQKLTSPAQSNNQTPASEYCILVDRSC